MLPDYKIVQARWMRADWKCYKEIVDSMGTSLPSVYKYCRDVVCNKTPKTRWPWFNYVNVRVKTYDDSKTAEISDKFPDYVQMVEEKKQEIAELEKSSRYWDDWITPIITYWIWKILQ